jgi:deoxyadenosine/deoxycytidine kinase
MYSLIMITGSSVGAGKTTLSALLYQQLMAHDVNAIWLQEENLEALLAQFVPNWHQNTVQPYEFLAACRALLDHYRTTDAVIITDSGLPGYIDFFGRFPTATLEALNQALYQTLQPRNPLLIYLASDVPTAFARATAQRGQQWAENIRNFLNSWQLPFYSSTPKPFATTHDLIVYFVALDRFARTMVAQWPGPTRILSTTETAPPDLLAKILAEFGLAVLPPADFRGSAPITDYIGAYERAMEGMAPERLTLQLIGNQLQLDTYWPGGTMLLAIQEDVFRLESTDRWLLFERDSSGQITGLRYQVLGQQVSYRKVTGVITSQHHPTG